jgi:hypothetical protein
VTAEALNAPLTNDMTLLEVAAHAEQPAAAEWLAARGAGLAVPESND